MSGQQKKAPDGMTGGSQISPVNLTKFLSSSGAASRRKAAILIKNGEVTVNGEIELNPARRVSDSDTITCEGKRITPCSTPHHYIMLNKPRGFVCTNSDIHAKKKALDLICLNDNPRLFSAGRLDKDSEGLILFSNDGDFVERLTHPRHKVEKTYEVSLSGPLTPDELQRILSGVSEDGEILRALHAEPVSACKYRLILGEGKNREIRRMMATLGKNVKRLKRVAVGALSLGSLKPGAWRELSEAELEQAFSRRETARTEEGTAPRQNKHIEGKHNGENH